jgi:hypothetical protein
MPANRSFRWSIPLITIVLVALASNATGAPSAGRQVTVQGRLEVLHQDTFGRGGSAHDYTLDTGKERLGLSFPDAGPHELAQAVVRVTGTRRGNQVSVPSSASPHVEMVRPAPAPGGGGGGSGGGSVTPVSGDRDTLVIMFNFADNPSYFDYTPTEMRGSMFTDTDAVANYYNEASFGAVTFSGKVDGAGDRDAQPGDVAGWYTLSQTSTNCSYSNWGSEARNMATADGWNLSGYEHIVHYFPLTTSCNWRGLGYIGGTDTYVNGSAVIFGDQPVEDLIAHEIGHNLTLYHAQGLDCTSGGARVSISSQCSVLTYQDRFDTMGRFYRHLNAFNKAHLGWIPGGRIVTTTADGTFSLAPLAAPATTTQLLRVDRGKTKGKISYAYVEYRRPSGLFDATVPAAGALIRLAPAFTTNSETHLIDADPSSPEFWDLLLPGHAFVDTVKNISILAVSENGTQLTVVVDAGHANVAPQAGAGAGDPLTVGVVHTHEGASANDADANLGRYQWTWVSCPATCPALTGATGSLASAPSGSNAAVPGPTYTPADPGTYRLSLTVWDTAGAKVTATVDEVATTAPSPAPEPGV